MGKRKKIKSSWSSYFNFSARERRGAIFLSVILILQIGVLYYIRHTKPPLHQADQKKFSMLISSIKSEEESAPVSIVAENKATYFPFNPNEMDAKSWTKLGMSEKQIKVIGNYIIKGGKFRTKKILKKCIVFLIDSMSNFMHSFSYLIQLFRSSRKIEKLNGKF